MPDDLVDRLREQAVHAGAANAALPEEQRDLAHGLRYTAMLLTEAAAEIERLRQFAPRVVNVDDSGHINLSPPPAGFGVKSG